MTCERGALRSPASMPGMRSTSDEIKYARSNTPSIASSSIRTAIFTSVIFSVNRSLQPHLGLDTSCLPCSLDTRGDVCDTNRE